MEVVIYQAIFVDRRNEKIYVFDDEHGVAQIPLSSAHYAYRKKVGGEFKSLFGDELEKIYNFDERDTDLFESDVPLEMKVLISAYPDSDEPSKGHRIIIFDIEVDSTGGFPDVSTADKTITAITLYDQVTEKYFSYVLDPEKKVADGAHDDITIQSFRAEENLLEAFLNKWKEINPTIVSGYNSNYFDIPYTYNRIKAVLGKQQAYSMSSINIAYQNKFNKKMVIAGVNCLDYIELYKKFLGVMKPSYALGAVAKDEELKTQKITYKGSLNDLYKNDIVRYVEYNLADVKVVVELDKKYDFIHLAQAVCHKGHVPYEWFQMSSRWIDGALLMYLHRHGGLIAPNKPIGGREEYEQMEKEGEEGFIGAYVKEPVPGMYDWICSADITSLYPSVIMSLNISTETKVAKIEGWDYKEFCKGNMPIVRVGETTYTEDEFKEMLKGQVFSISTNGVLFRQDVPGVIPTILDLWFKERLQYREFAKKYRRDGDAEKAAFYNRRQLREKIFLNSVYGCIGLPVWRFYDRDNAEAVTVSGQTIIKAAEQLVNRIYQQKFQNAGKVPTEQDFVKYIDTDSIYISSCPLALCEKEMPTDMKQFTIDTISYIAGQINEFYKIMVPQVFNIKPEKNRIKIVGDVVAKKAMWIAKKRYAMLKVFDMENMSDVKDKKGNEGKMDVKGIDIVRSSFPAAFRKVASDVLDMLLRDSPKETIDELILKFEETIDGVPILDLGKTTSVKFISQNGQTNYNPLSRKPFQFEKKSPVGVKSALAYNDFIKVWKLTKKVEPVYHGQKIKWVYLIPNEFGIESLALKGDDTDPDQIVDFITKYIDRRAMYEAELKSKLSEFYDVIKWDYPNFATQAAIDFFGSGGETGNDW